MHLTPYQAVMLWDQLSNAFHGKGSFGEHVAEIIPWTCMEYSPAYAMAPREDVSRESRHRAQYAIHELCLMFERKHKCSITAFPIDPEHPGLDQLLDSDYIDSIFLQVLPDGI
jgi:hypothetical protein